MYTLHSCTDCMCSPLNNLFALSRVTFSSLILIIIKGVITVSPTHEYINTIINSECDSGVELEVRIKLRIQKDSNPVKCQQPPAVPYFSFSPPPPSISRIFCHIGVEPESSHAPNWDTHTHKPRHTEDKRERKSREETVDLRGQMKECWSVDVVLTIALCHISKADCLKRIIYIS